MQSILRLNDSEDKWEGLADLCVFRNRLWRLLSVYDRVVLTRNKSSFICREEFVPSGPDFG